MADEEPWWYVIATFLAMVVCFLSIVAMLVIVS